MEKEREEVIKEGGGRGGNEVYWKNVRGGCEGITKDEAWK